jgi:hypothetical protein
MLTEELLAPQLDHHGKRCCSVCGCTEEHPCAVVGLACAWISPTLCSCCAWAEPGVRELNLRHVADEPHVTLTPSTFGTQIEVTWP